MTNMIANARRVKKIIGQLEKAGYSLESWTEDGQYDSPKLEMVNEDGENILVAVEKDSIHVSQWGDKVLVNYVEYKSVAAFILRTKM